MRLQSPASSSTFFYSQPGTPAYSDFPHQAALATPGADNVTPLPEDQQKMQIYIQDRRVVGVSPSFISIFSLLFVALGHYMLSIVLGHLSVLFVSPIDSTTSARAQNVPSPRHIHPSLSAHVGTHPFMTHPDSTLPNSVQLRLGSLFCRPVP